MQRKALGRDLGLTLRMLVVGAVVGLLYAAAAAITLLIVLANWTDPRAWFVPLVPASLFWSHYRSADEIVLRAARAKVVGRTEAPDLHSAVERLCALAGLEKPKLALARSDVPNAFATGRSPRRATVVVTTGLLKRLNRGELEAVLAHELAHIANRDALVITIASFFQMVGALFSRRRFRDRDFAEKVKLTDFRERAAFVVIKPFALIFYGFTTLLTLAMSRYREYSADRGAVLVTGRPEQLMSALQKISDDIARIPSRDLRALSGLNAFFIIPASLNRGRFEFLMDHPPLEKRLRALTEIAQELGRPVV